jgi:hypothetical protein
MQKNILFAVSLTLTSGLLFGAARPTTPTPEKQISPLTSPTQSPGLSPAISPTVSPRDDKFKGAPKDPVEGKLETSEAKRSGSGEFELLESEKAPRSFKETGLFIVGKIWDGVRWIRPEGTKSYRLIAEEQIRNGTFAKQNPLTEDRISLLTKATRHSMRNIQKDSLSGKDRLGQALLFQQECRKNKIKLPEETRQETLMILNTCIIAPALELQSLLNGCETPSKAHAKKSIPTPAKKPAGRRGSF